MSTDIAKIDTTEQGLDFLEKQAKAMDAAYRLGDVLSRTQMVPATYRGKPEDAAAAILYGAEVGLKPQQALQQVFVVHGQPAIYARTMVALLKAKGYTFTTVESSDESVTVTGRSPRGEEETSTWTIDRAKKAGYTTNKKYNTDPQAMLYAKAASEVSRKLAPDVLLGIKYTAEDLELEPAMKATATRMDRPADRGADMVRQALAEKQQQSQPAEDAKLVEQTKPTVEEITQRALAAIAKAETDTELDKIMNHAHQQDLNQDVLDMLADKCGERAQEVGIV